MLYQRTLVIPAGTTEQGAVSAVLKLTVGASTRREVAFAAGCHGEVKVKVFHGGWQILPMNRDEWLIGDDATIIDASVYPIEGVPNTFTVYGYNDDFVNDHKVVLRVQMVEGRLAAGMAKFIETLKRFGVI